MSELTREQIYHELNEERYFLQRHEGTPRIMLRTNFLLDQLLELQHQEALQLLEEEANNE
jgi:hypothetical protein